MISVLLSVSPLVSGLLSALDCLALGSAWAGAVPLAVHKPSKRLSRMAGAFTGWMQLPRVFFSPRAPPAARHPEPLSRTCSVLVPQGVRRGLTLRCRGPEEYD